MKMYRFTGTARDTPEFSLNKIKIQWIQRIQGIWQIIDTWTGVSRKSQNKDVYRRTIEIRAHYEPLNSN